MIWSEVMQQIKQDFDDDIKKGLAPLAVIKDFAPADTLEDLKELMVAVGFFAYKEGKKAAKDANRTPKA